MMKGNYGYYSYSSDKSYAKIRRRRAIRNIILITILTASLIFSLGWLSFEVADEVRDNRDIAISKLKNAVKQYNAAKVTSENIITPQCINGNKVVVIDGVTYYAGTVDTWGDIKGENCE